MSEKKQCPLCGKHVGENDHLCEECQNHVDNQYKLDLLNVDSDVVIDDHLALDEPIPVSTTGSQEDMSDRESETAPVMRKEGMSKGIIFFLLGCLLVVVIGVTSVVIMRQNRASGVSEELYWNNCVEENTPVSYAKYLVSYPEGRYIEEANNRIREFREEEVRAWEKLKKSSDINDFYAYLSENPQTPHISQIRFLMDSLSWLSTTKDNTVESYKAYIENVNLGNISGEYIAVAQDKYKYLSELVILEGSKLDSLVVDINSLFGEFSKYNPKSLLKIFAEKVSYYGKDLSSTDLVANLDKEKTDKDIKEIVFSPQKETIKAKQDNEGAFLIGMSLNKEIVYNTQIKNGKKTENKRESKKESISLKLNKDKQILLINKE